MQYTTTTNRLNSEVVSTIAAMLRQEETIYKKCDSIYHHRITESIRNRNVCTENIAIDEECRNKMASWCYEVIDFCHMNRETAEIALSYIDRYIMTTQGFAAVQDCSVYQLACMTSLYIAVKIHEPRVVDSKFVSKLSNGLYNVNEIETMEVSILEALQWRMNPPTSLGFVRQFLDLFLLVQQDESINDQVKEAAYDLSKLQTETAVRLSEFSTVSASTIAYCALINSFESLGLHSKIPYLMEVLQHHILSISNEGMQNIFHAEVPLIQSGLLEAISTGHSQTASRAYTTLSTHTTASVLSRTVSSDVNKNENEKCRIRTGEKTTELCTHQERTSPRSCSTNTFSSNVCVNC